MINTKRAVHSAMSFQWHVISVSPHSCSPKVAGPLKANALRELSQTQVPIYDQNSKPFAGIPNSFWSPQIRIPFMWPFYGDLWDSWILFCLSFTIFSWILWQMDSCFLLPSLLSGHAIFLFLYLYHVKFLLS